VTSRPSHNLTLLNGLTLNFVRSVDDVPPGVVSGANEADLVHSGLEDTMIEAYANVRSITKMKVFAPL